MIYLLYGTDTHKSRTKLHEMLEILSKKRPNSEIFKITSENWSEDKLLELFSSKGLFDQKYIVVLDNLFEKKEIKEFILEHMDEMKLSEHPFLILDGKVDTVSLKKIEKTAQKIQEFEKSENYPPSHGYGGVKKEYNAIFKITDGLLLKDKKKLWIDYTDLISQGVVAEEIHGLLFWQVKNMILAERSDSQNETGLTPFQYKNALTGSRKYKDSELVKMSGDLVEMTSRVRAGEGDLNIMLEKWILCL